MKTYISIPITGKDEQLQRTKAADIKNKLAPREAVNPFDLADELIKKHDDERRPFPTWQEFLDVDIPELLKCDIIYMCRDWEHSKGCNVELQTAIENKLSIFFEK